MATLLQAQVIVIATTGTVSKAVRAYGQRVSETTAFQVVFVDHEVLEEYRRGGAPSLRERFREDARMVMRLKRPQVLDTLDKLVGDES